ncbi:ATP-binding protein [Trujillonella endophytica]|uniref:Regulatory protein, luxR family n=1 Tax=Trujillonella endophytica TaxID=673521 RepID=A0A1H8V2X4_9ACTN|nr:AAA family ATPase [Trujillella endophytica]SEP09583.1 regulatory protein, luxR family [Trujillella endophytica]
MPGVPQWEDRPLVGRAAELTRLLGAVDRAVAGSGAAVLLAGDAGVGKTRLLDELAARATERGLRVLTGHCVDLGDVGLPYLPFVDLLRPLAADPATAGSPALADLLAGRAGGTAPEPPAEDAGELGRPLPSRAIRIPVDDGRLQLFESVAGMLAELGAQAPLLLVVEDLHWADRSSRDLLRYLLARLAEEPVAVVASYRADDLHRRHPLRPLLAELVRLPGVERLELAPLPAPAVGQLVRDLAADVPEATVDDVVARAEGNAFYAQELVAAGLAGESLPLALTDVLLARVEQLGPGAQRVLRTAAVAGRQVRHELVAAVSGLPATELEPALAEAVHRHLLVVSPDGRYRFRHALLREAVLADLLPGERVRLHAAVAAHLADHPGAGTAAERAHHARESNDLPTALTASLEAAADAGRVGAPAERLQHLEAALALWPAVPDAQARTARDHPGLLLEAAAAARAGGELHRAVAFLRAAQEVLGPDGDRATLARVHYTLAQALGRIEDQAAAHRESSRAMALVPASPPSSARTWAAATHARTAYDVGLWEEGNAAAEEALAAADALGLDSAWADTAVTLARARGGAPAAVVARLEEALARARRSGDRDVELRVLFNLAVVPYEAGDVARGVHWTDTALARAEELGVPWTFYAAELRHLGVSARYVAGDWDGSLALAERLARVPEMGAHVRAASLLVQVGRGDPAAVERLAWARGLSARLEAHVLLLLATAGAAIDLAAWAGDAETAAREAEEAEQQLGALWGDDRLAAVRLVATALAPVADAAAAARSAGDAGAERRWVDRGAGLVAAARSAVADHRRAIGEYGVEGAAWLARVAAEEERLHGRPAAEAWRAAVEAFDYGHVYEQARSRWRLAEALLAAGDREAAAVELQRAADVAVRLGARPLREAVVALARRGRLAVDVPGLGRLPDAAAVFTPREAEVLALLARGRTNRQIGAELFISEKTASVHVSNILAKLGAGGRTEAVAIAAARGLLPTPEPSGG